MSAFKELLEQTPLEPEYGYLREPPSGKARLWHKAFEIFCAGLFNLYCPLKVFGRENLPAPPFLLCSNHSSHMDSVALMYASRLGFGRFGMIAAKDYFFDNAKRKNSLPLLMNLIPADRKSTRQTIARLMVACREFSQCGPRSIIIYPEGTRSLTGEIAPLKKGVAMIAAELHLPIVPAYIHGTFQSLPKGVGFPRPRRIRVHFGKPIIARQFADDAADTGAGTGRLIYTHITNELEQRLRALRDHHHTTHGH